MYGSEKEVVRTHHGDKLRSFRQIFLHPLYLRGNLFINSGSIGTGCLENHIENGRLTVHLTTETICHSAQLYFRHIFQAEYRAVLTRTDNRILKFLHALQASAIFHRKLENVLRTLTQRTGRSFNILLTQYSGDVRRYQPILCHPFRFQPDTHTIRITQLHDVSHSLDTFYLGNNIDVQVIGQEGLVITAISTDQSTDLQETGLALHRAYTDFRNFGRK